MFSLEKVMGVRSSRMTINRWDRYFFRKSPHRKGRLVTLTVKPLELYVYAVDEEIISDNNHPFF
jgi:hypothetical protein